MSYVIVDNHGDPVEVTIVEQPVVVAADVSNATPTVVSTAPTVFQVVGDNASTVEVVTDSTCYDVEIIGGIIIGDGGTTPGEGGGVPELFQITATGLPEGDNTLSGPAVWNTSKCLIKEVAIETLSTNWSLWVLQNNNGLSTDDASIPARKIMEGGSGNERITVDIAYEDEDSGNDVNLHFEDADGTSTFNVYVTGTELA